MSAPKPVVLCILDGWGLREEETANAPKLARTPTMDRLLAICPNATLVTHGPDVGLPAGQMGNSEVGHMNIGAGRVVSMDLGQIDLAIEDGSFASNAALVAFVDTLKRSGGAAHLAGIVSEGGVHGHIQHVIAAVETICAHGVPAVVHVITDGRDVPPRSADGFVAELQCSLPKGAVVGSVCGRYYVMDRDNRWERVQRAYDVMVKGKGHTVDTAVQAVEDGYARGESDEFLEPATVGGYSGMADGDGLFFLNFRADRAREILRALAEPEFSEFDTGKRPVFAAVLGMVDYSDRHNDFMATVFPKQKVVNTLGAWVAKHGLRQFRLAETEKYPHVTFFLNGGIEAPEEGEDRYMPASPKVATYDLQPEMSSAEVTEQFVGAIQSGYDLIVVNYANPDMVGHTGDINAAIAACEAVDNGLGQVIEALESVGGAMIVTADHGNCETMIDPESGGPHTAHTTNPVPVVLVGGPEGATLAAGRLSDLAPSLLDLMGLPLPDEMTGRSLIHR